MKVLHNFGHEPTFELSFDERAILISALQTFIATFTQDQTAKQMLNTAEQIDLAMRAQAEKKLIIVGGEFNCSCGNYPNAEGAFPCDREGNYVDPCPDEWPDDLYVCDRCGVIFRIPEADGPAEIVGQRGGRS